MILINETCFIRQSVALRIPLQMGQKLNINTRAYMTFGTAAKASNQSQGKSFIAPLGLSAAISSTETIMQCAMKAKIKTKRPYTPMNARNLSFYIFLVSKKGVCRIENIIAKKSQLVKNYLRLGSLSGSTSISIFLMVCLKMMISAAPSLNSNYIHPDFQRR